MILPLSRLSPGVRLAQPVFSSTGEMIFDAGSKLTAGAFDRLNAMGIVQVYVEDSLPVDLDPLDRGRIYWWGEGAGILHRLFLEAANNGEIRAHLRRARAFARRIASHVRGGMGCVPHLAARPMEDLPCLHSVATSMWSVAIAWGLGLSGLKLEEIALGGLLHDIGTALLKRGVAISAEEGGERDATRRHPEVGYRLLKGRVAGLVANAVRQHHERLDGTGYPRRLCGDEIHEYAKVIMVADLYDALMADRPHRPGIPSRDALVYLRQCAGHKFDIRCVARLARVAPWYPRGQAVVLSNGAIGVACDSIRRKPHAPFLLMLCDAAGKRPARPTLCSLDLDSSIKIVGTLTDLSGLTFNIRYGP